MIFFLLSGFFIHLRISKQLATEKSFEFNLGDFFKRRLHRLAPPYFFALTLTVILDLTGNYLYPTLYRGLTGDALLDLNFQRKEFSLTSVIPALFMLPSIFGKDFGTNGPLWSLAYEVVYYLIYPLWLYSRRLGILPAYGLGIGLAIIAIMLPNTNFVSQVLIHYPIWLTGALICEILIKKQLPSKMDGWISRCVFVVGFSAIHIPQPLWTLILAYVLLGSSTIVMILSLSTAIHKNKVHIFMEQIGISSYTIYICHFPIVTLISAWAIETFGNRPLDGWLAVGGFIFTLLVTQVCFLCGERYFIHSRLKI